MVSSSTDETIEVYNMVRRCHVRTILQHSGTVTSLTFTPDESHLISTSDDGSIAMFETGSWKLKKLWDKAHKGLGKMIITHLRNKETRDEFSCKRAVF